jgi:hypothetical protein
MRDLTIFKATVLLLRCSWPINLARWHIAKPPFPSCGPVAYCRPSGSLTTSGGGSAWTEGADIGWWCREVRGRVVLKFGPDVENKQGADVGKETPNAEAFPIRTSRGRS